MPLLAEKSSSAVSTAARTAPTGEANWVSVVSHLDPKYGGLSAAVPALASAVASTGQYATTVAAFCLPEEQFRPSVPHHIDYAYYPVQRLGWRTDRTVAESFDRLVDESAGLHIHGLWEASTSRAAHVARCKKKPYIVSAHGMLESWALANKRLKKLIYAALFERANLNRAACLHALTEAEARDYRHFGLNNPIAIIPNGVNVPLAPSADLFLDRFPSLRDKSLVLFLGRIHYKKGLDILADAWAKVSAKFQDAHLVVAGPDFEGTQARIASRLEDLSLSGRVTFTGMLGGELKWSALAAARCFILPSYSEGLSVSVLEAMGSGVPVIVTEQCNLPDVKAFDCGWTIQPQVSQVESALTSVFQAGASDLRAVGENGKRLVAQRYTWPVVGQQMASLYQWLNGGDVPYTVNLQPGRAR